MITALIVLLLMIGTYLATDYLRWLEINKIEAANVAKMEEMTSTAYNLGVQVGRIRTRRMYDASMPNLN